MFSQNDVHVTYAIYYVQLFDRRKKSVRGSEQSWWDQLSIEYMSFESSDDKEDAITVHSLPWRSQSKNRCNSV